MQVFGKQERNCKRCGTAYVYRPAGKDKGKTETRGLFCSNACKLADTKDRRPLPFSKVYFGKCSECNTTYTARRPGKYCSKACGVRMQASIKALVALPNTHTLDCRECGATYTVTSDNVGGMPTRYCSEACREKVKAVQKREDKAARKARLKRVTVEKVDPFKVFERDGWRCRLCGVDTPKAHRGTHLDDAPELDHVVPLSKGGAHSYRNTQCTCRKCNQLKSNKIIDLKNFAKWGRVYPNQPQNVF